MDGTTTRDLVKNWFERQYVTEVQTRYSLATSKPGRLSMIYTWRIQPHVSLWKALPEEAPPTSWPREPLLASLNKQAREAWERCDKAAAQELHAMWTHACDNPYYCPCHGIGSD